MAKKTEDKTLEFKTDGYYICRSEAEYKRRGGKFLEELTGDYRKFGRDFAVEFGTDTKGRRVERIYRVDSDGKIGNLKEDRIITRNGYEVISYDDEKKPEKRTVYGTHEWGNRIIAEEVYVEYLDGSLDRPTYSVDYRPTRDGKGKTERWYDEKGKVKEKVETHRRKSVKSGEIVTVKRYKGEDEWQETEQALIQKNLLGGDKLVTISLFRGFTSDYEEKLVQKKIAHFNAKTGRTNIFVEDGKGREIQRRVVVDFQGKFAKMDPERGFFSRIKGRLFGKNGDKGGKVLSTGMDGAIAHFFDMPLYLDDDDIKHLPTNLHNRREDINKELQEILKDSSLSGYKKKKKLRETIAKFREESGCKAPNKKVGEKLKEYLPPKKEKIR